MEDLDDEHVLARFEEVQARMAALVGEAVRERTSIAVPLINTLNGVTSDHLAWVAALRDRLPTSIVLLLFLAAFVAVTLVGLEQGAVQPPRVASVAGFILIVSLTVYATLDLNQPTRGAIRVSEEPIERVLRSMVK